MKNLKKIFLNPFIYPTLAYLFLFGYLQFKLFIQHSVNLDGRILSDFNQNVAGCIFILFIKIGIWIYFSGKKSTNYLLLLTALIDILLFIGSFINSIEIMNLHIHYEEYSRSFRQHEYGRITTKNYPFQVISGCNFFYFVFLVILFYFTKPKEEDYSDVLDH